MGYCSLNDIERILAQALTTASPNPSMSSVPGKLTSIGRKLKLDLVTEDDANFYIKLAMSFIDADIGQQYICPLNEKCDFETTLTDEYINEYTDEYAGISQFSVANGSALMPGNILFFAGLPGEKGEILTIDRDLRGNDIVQLREPLTGTYTQGTRILRLKYPDPIPFIAARLAAATIYDKYARAQSEPGKTEFGNTLREEAETSLNDIREGRTILFGASRRGWRFADAELVDRYALRKGPDEDSTRSSDHRR